MSSILPFPAPDHPLPFPADEVASLGYAEGRAMIMAAQHDWLAPALADLVAELRELLPRHGVVPTAHRLGLPEAFVCGCAVELILSSGLIIPAGTA